MTKASCILVLENPPQGPSVADGYAERCNQGAEIRMKKTMSQIERRKLQTELQLEKERKKIVKDLNKIKSSKFKKSQSKSATSNFLETERSKLREQFENSKMDSTGSDFDSSEDSVDERSDCFSEDGSTDSLQGNSEMVQHRQKSPRAFNRHRASYQERSREDRITNLHRRYSAQISTGTVIDVKRVKKQQSVI